MELPEEDHSALAKRRAIQALMKDKTLTPSERSARMQDIIKGNFTDPGPIVAPATAAAKDGAPRESVSTQKSKPSASVQSYGSSSSEDEYSSSSSSSCSSSYSSASSYTRDDESSKSSGRSNNRPASKAIANTEATSSISVGTGSGTRHSQGSSTVDPRNEAWEHSNLSASTYGMEEKESKTVEQQKERQRKLLEISRNTSLTSDERSLQIKAVMKTNVEEEVRRKRRGNMRESLSINESISIPFDDTESLLWEGESRRSLLNLSSGQIANEMTQLIQRLKNNDATLTELDLKKRRLGDEDVIPLFDTFGDNTHVSSLNLASNRIGNEGCSALASAILDNTSLTLIDLSGNNIGDEGIEDLCKVIPYNKTLSQLNLADNKIGDSGASGLAGSLVDNTSLLHINLNGNFIGDEGATDIFKVLATTNSTLQSLLLRMNGVTDRGASALASALIENETIVSIDLGQNRIGNKGGTDLLKVLSCNETIEEMKLDGNKNVDQEVLLEIQRQLNCCESCSEEEEDGSQNGSEFSSVEDVSGTEGAEGLMTTRRISSNYKINDKADSNNENDSDSEVEELGMNMQHVDENATAKEESNEDSKQKAVSTLYAGEAVLVDMPNEDSLTHAKREAIQTVMQKEDSSAVERNRQIQDIMAGKVEAPKADPTQPAVEPLEDSGSIERANIKLDYTTIEHSNSINKAINTLEMSDASLNNGHIFQRKVSYENGTHTAIAYEWKQKMMAVHPKSHDNKLDVLLAHKYRLSLRSAPNQSSFRVVAVVFFAVAKKEDRFHVVGSNDEPNSVSGSICAERAALLQLRFVPDLEEITKIVIVTDDVDPISPGMLCREFMASFKKMPESTPILLGRAVCRNCGLNLSGKTCGDAKGIFDPTNHHLQETHQKLFGDCLVKKGAKYSSPHDFIGSVISLPELFPYPSLYARLSAEDAFAYGQSYAARKAVPKQNPNEGCVGVRPLTSSVRATRTESTVGSYKQERFDLSLISDALSEDKPDTSSARKTPEPQVDRPSTSFSASLKTTVDLMRQIREDGDDNRGERGLNEMMPGILDHLKAKTLKISSRLKPSQRREKLMRLATEATTLEIPQRHIHPIRYGAAVLFNDGTVALASQKIAFEYGCTLDAVGQLASVIDRKCVQLDEESLACKPVMIVQCDQFGIAHAPFATGRSFLTERGYGDCKVLIHQQRSSKRSMREVLRANDNEADESNTDLRLVEVSASDLAPSPPDIFGKVMAKNHSHGLQIEF